MKETTILYTALGLATLVTAGPIPRPDIGTTGTTTAAVNIPSPKSDSAAKNRIFDNHLEDFFSTLNYPDDDDHMTIKRSTDLEGVMSSKDGEMASEAGALKDDRDGVGAYIDDLAMGGDFPVFRRGRSRSNSTPDVHLAKRSASSGCGALDFTRCSLVATWGNWFRHMSDNYEKCMNKCREEKDKFYDERVTKEDEEAERDDDEGGDEY